jgi:transcriptional regulator with XRE-family HTH domain
MCLSKEPWISAWRIVQVALDGPASFDLLMTLTPGAWSFDVLLRDALGRRGMSNKDLANVLQVSENTVSSWTTGRYRPGHDRAQRIAGALGLTMDQLYGRHRYKVQSLPRQRRPPDRSAEEAQRIVRALAELDLEGPLGQLERLAPPLMEILAASRRVARGAAKHPRDG